MSDTSYDMLSELALVKDVVDTLLKGSASVLIHGPGGTGKSTLTRDVIHYLHSHHPNIKVGCTASTGVAAVNLLPKSEGKEMFASTLHSWAGVGLANLPLKQLITNIQTKRIKLNRWLKTDVLIIDEISMVGSYFFSLLDAIGRTLRGDYLSFENHHKPFGGIKLLMIGDFLQLPPVRDEWMFLSRVWHVMEVAVYPLKEPKRYDDPEYFDLLSRLRVAKPNSKDLKLLRSRVLSKKELAKLEDLTQDPLKVKPTMLHSVRVDVEEKNLRNLELLPGRAVTFPAIDTFKLAHRGDPNIAAAILSKLLEEKLPAELKLKVGAQVMLKVNLDLEAGLVNGSRGVVTQLLNLKLMMVDPNTKKPDPDFDGPVGSAQGVMVLWRSGVTTQVTPYMWEVKTQDGKAARKQLPLILAWALTAHKAQGSTLDYALCDLGPSIFSPGQAYVMLSRIRNKEGLLLSSFDEGKITADPVAVKFVGTLEVEDSSSDEEDE